MTPEFLQSTFAVAAKLEIGMKGELVTFRRAPSSETDPVRAKVSGYNPDELGGGIQQGDRKILVCASDVTLPGGLQIGDKIVLAASSARPLNTQVIDAATMRAAGVLIVTARG